MATIRGTEFNDVLQGTNSNDRIFAYHGNNIVWANKGNDIVYGGDDIDWLFGGDDDDRLFGKLGQDWIAGDDGNDFIDGGEGDDRMEGGKGNDIFIVQDAGDNVIERAGEGIDRVQAYMNKSNGFESYTLHDNVENLRVLGGQDYSYSVTGNNLDNHIHLISRSVKQGRFYAEGGNGNDTIFGSNIQDFMWGENGADELIGNGGADAIWGGTGNDTLRGGASYDWLQGFENGRNANSSADDIDILEGGSGSDRFIITDNGHTPYAVGSGYAIIEDFNLDEDTIHIGTYSLGSRSFTLRGGDFDLDGSRDDTGIYVGTPTATSLIGVVLNEVGLSLDARYFR